MSNAQLEIRLPDNTLLYNSDLNNSLKLFKVLTLPKSNFSFSRKGSYVTYEYVADWISPDNHFTAGSVFFISSNKIIAIFTSDADEFGDYPDPITLEVFKV